MKFKIILLLFGLGLVFNKPIQAIECTGHGQCHYDDDLGGCLSTWYQVQCDETNLCNVLPCSEPSCYIGDNCNYDTTPPPPPPGGCGTACPNGNSDCVSDLTCQYKASYGYNVCWADYPRCGGSSGPPAPDPYEAVCDSYTIPSLWSPGEWKECQYL